MCAAASSRVLAVRAQIATWAPSRASSSAMARPSPLLAAAAITWRRISFAWRGSAALRCNQLPTAGGAYAPDQVVEWCAIFAGMFGRSRIRTADRQVRSDSGGVGGGPRVDGDQRGDGGGPKAGVDRKVCCGA